MAHSIVEVSPTAMQRASSLNGSKTDIVFTHAHYPDNWKSYPIEEKRKIAWRNFLIKERSHAAVDVVATVILKKAGLNTDRGLYALDFLFSYLDKMVIDPNSNVFDILHTVLALREKTVRNFLQKSTF